MAKETPIRIGGPNTKIPSPWNDMLASKKGKDQPTSMTPYHSKDAETLKELMKKGLLKATYCNLLFKRQYCLQNKAQKGSSPTRDLPKNKTSSLHQQSK